LCGSGNLVERGEIGEVKDRLLQGAWSVCVVCH